MFLERPDFFTYIHGCQISIGGGKETAQEPSRRNLKRRSQIFGFRLQYTFDYCSSISERAIMNPGNLDTYPRVKIVGFHVPKKYFHYYVHTF